jgi:hypothetical protein
VEERMKMVEQPKEVENRLNRAVIDSVVGWWLGFARWMRAAKHFLMKREKENDK